MGECIIACRTSSYAPFTRRAYQHLAGLGIRHVEIPVPKPRKLRKVAAELRSFGLSATSLHAECDVRREDIAAQLAAQLPAFDALGARIMFVSVRADQTPPDVVYARLRQAGDLAAAQGVTIVLETHPDLATNASVGLETMLGVGHPNVRVNFDTANIYFYNQGVDGIAELRRIGSYVAAVHLKDTDGGYRSWHFPALGRGVVRFAEVFQVLDGFGFKGPYTIEIEGIQGERKSERLVYDRVAESVGYLRGLGRL